MIVEFNENFDKDLSKIDKKIINRVFDKISLLENSESIRNITGIKKLQGFSIFYRIRIGDYRMGLSINNGKIVLERFLHRKDIYKYYPK